MKENIITQNHILLFASIACALFFSWYFFLGQSIRFDEAQSLWASSQTFPFASQIAASRFESPLYMLLLHAFGFFFGTSIVAARILSVTFFMGSVAAVYFLGKETYSKTHGLFAAALFAISPFMNWYANEARMYSLFALLVAVNQYFFARLLKQNSTAAWIGYALTALAGCYTHYFFFFALLAHVAFLVLFRNTFATISIGKFIAVIGGIFVLFLPWLIYMASVGSISAIAATQVPDSVSVFNTISNFLFGFNTEHLNTIIVSLWPLTVLLAFLSLRHTSKHNPFTLFFIFCMVIPIFGLFIISVVAEPLFLSRYLILTLPSLYLFLSSLIFTYPKRLSVILQVALVVATFSFLAFEAIDASVPVKENYRQASEYLQQNAGPADIIAISTPVSLFPMEYYYHGAATLTTIPAWNRYQTAEPPPFAPQELENQTKYFQTNYQRLWLLLSQDQGNNQQIKAYFDTHFEQIHQTNFSTNLNLYVYKLNY